MHDNAVRGRPRSPRRDLFAEIATRDTSQPQPHASRADALVVPEPPTLPDVTLPLDDEPAVRVIPRSREETPAALQAELELWRARYAGFLECHAPVPPTTRMRVPLRTFEWQLEDGPWQEVRIPHYGPPIGRATATYRTTFELSKAMRAQDSIWLCFGGADYVAHVSVNGAHVGSHEGFFAPFELDATPYIRDGDNELVVRIENDAIMMGNDSWGDDGELYEGDKLYAATGPGWDQPGLGWHHCPPGMGIYQEVWVEARDALHIRDVFVRPLADDQGAPTGEVETWVEVYNATRLRKAVSLSLSLYGQNWDETILEDQSYELAGPAGPGVNYYRLPLTVSSASHEARIWSPDAPWLYQLQISLSDGDGRLRDATSQTFGLRTFTMEREREPLGRLYLNGEEIRLRGANTMGHLQQCVLQNDLEQLRDDILLCRIANMNYLRLTQRPVQPAIYTMCDALGMLTQTDLPLFGVLRRNQWSEAVRQAGEMERLVRGHPCNIMVTYINEPFPDGRGSLHRHCSRDEMEAFFEAADRAVHLENPDRVIKAVDGDYDPPGPGLPDNHCYCGWYNGHGVDLGRLHKGWWQPVKPGWRYGCGEFGAEGLDYLDLMRRRYPADWLPASAEDQATWTPDRIAKAQTGRFHYLWFDTQHSLEDWSAASQDHQAWATRLMTEAFRRDDRMQSFAIHLGIDAFPAGWMKAIMDVERRPKPAYWAYRDALTPIMVSLRTDRYAFWSGQEAALEAWVCCDPTDPPEGLLLRYQLEHGGKILASGEQEARVTPCGSAFQGWLRLKLPDVARRSQVTVRLALVDAADTPLHDTYLALEVFAKPELPRRAIVTLDETGDRAHRLAHELGLDPIAAHWDALAPPGASYLVGDGVALAKYGDMLRGAAEGGATVLTLGLPPGEHEVLGIPVTVTACGMNARHFASRATGHPLVADLDPHDVRFWYDADAGMVTPFLHATFQGNGWTPILTSGNGDWSGEWHPALAAAERLVGSGVVRLCQADLAGRAAHNPSAYMLAARMLSLLPAASSTPAKEK
ncbi:MAG: glycosyl hydrolase 2 galactose-binding domain-containing protein [Anaerolineae bacterium]